MNIDIDEWVDFAVDGIRHTTAKTVELFILNPIALTLLIPYTYMGMEEPIDNALDWLKHNVQEPIRQKIGVLYGK